MTPAILEFQKDKADLLEWINLNRLKLRLHICDVFRKKNIAYANDRWIEVITRVEDWIKNQDDPAIYNMAFPDKRHFCHFHLAIRQFGLKSSSGENYYDPARLEVNFEKINENLLLQNAPSAKCGEGTLDAPKSKDSKDVSLLEVISTANSVIHRLKQQNVRFNSCIESERDRVIIQSYLEPRTINAFNNLLEYMFIDKELFEKFCVEVKLLDVNAANFTGELVELIKHKITDPELATCFVNLIRLVETDVLVKAIKQLSIKSGTKIKTKNTLEKVGGTLTPKLTKGWIHKILTEVEKILGDRKEWRFYGTRNDAQEPSL